MTSVGVVVPCKDEAATIGRCLRSLRTQSPAPAAIVVVDNGSTDGSLPIARADADEVLEVGGGVISQLRNRGVAALPTVDVVTFVDADVELGTGWLDAALHGLEEATLVGSRLNAAPDATWVAKRWAAIEARQATESSQLWSQAMAIRREAFLALGGFDEALATGEDVDLSHRVRATGGSVRFVPEMVAVHHGWPSHLRGFARRERWHTSHPGWFARSSRKSQALIMLTAGWLALGTMGAAVAAGRRSPAPVLAWAAASAVGLPALGWSAGGTPRHAIQDGTLMAIWAGTRAVRLPAEILQSRSQ